MNAAITADRRGHIVDLFEMDSVLGGQLICSEYDKSKQDLKRYKDYLIVQLKKSHVRIHLGTKATPSMIHELSPDSLIVALGAYPSMIPVKGSERNHTMSAVDAFENIDKIGKDVVIIGGGSIGCELGVDLAKQEKNVTIVEIGPILNRTLNDIMPFFTQSSVMDISDSE